MSFPKTYIKYEIPPAPLVPPTTGEGGDGGGGGEPPVPIIPVVSTASEGLAPIIPAGSGNPPHSFLSDSVTSPWQRVSYFDLTNTPLGLPPLPHAASHISGNDPLPPPTLSSPGLVPALPIDPTLVFGGGGAWIPVPKVEGLPPPANDPSQYLRSDAVYAPLPMLAPGRAGIVPAAPADATLVLLGNAKWGEVPGGGGGTGGTVSWDAITGKPSTFPPSVHAPSHITGTDLISLTTVAAPGLTPALPNTNATIKWLRGDASFSPIPLSTVSAPGFVVALPNTGATSLWLRGDNSFSTIPAADITGPGLLNTLTGTAANYVGGDNACHGSASTSAPGLLNVVSGNTGDYVGGDNACHPVPTAATGLLPPGTIIDFGGWPPPAGFLACDGSSYPTASYPALFAAITYRWGGSGANFNVPDLRSRTTVGCFWNGSAYTAPPGLTPRSIAQTGGEENHVLTVAELVSHTHGVAHTHTLGNHTHGVAHTHTMANHSHTYDHYHNVGWDHCHYDPGVNHLHGLGGHTHSTYYVNIFAGNTWGGGSGISYGGTNTNSGGPSTASDACDRSMALNTYYASQTSTGWGNSNTNWASQQGYGTSAGPNTNTSDGASIGATAGPSTNTSDGASIANTDGGTGGGGGHNTMPPFAGVVKIIKT